ncbi:MAG: hypothetical protein IH921_00115 [Gemmatimonadetes bacterium]|nr:hypothetical protein [Gemmatimonadota bacterium]
MRKRFHQIHRVVCGRCGYKQYNCQCGSSQRPAEFRKDMRLVRDDRGRDPLVPGLIERLQRPTLVEVAGS